MGKVSPEDRAWNRQALEKVKGKVTEDTLIDDLPIMTKAVNALKKAGFKKLGDVMLYNTHQLLRIPGIGRDALAQLTSLIVAEKKRKVRKNPVPEGVFLYYVRVIRKNEKGRGSPILAVAFTISNASLSDNPVEDEVRIARATALCAPEDWPPKKAEGRSRAIHRLRYIVEQKVARISFKPLWLMDERFIRGTGFRLFPIGEIKTLLDYNGFEMRATEYEKELIRKAYAPKENPDA